MALKFWSRPVPLPPPRLVHLVLRVEPMAEAQGLSKLSTTLQPSCRMLLHSIILECVTKRFVRGLGTDQGNSEATLCEKRQGSQETNYIAIQFMCIFFKSKMSWGWRDGSGVKSATHSSILGGSRLSVTPAAGALMPSSGTVQHLHTDDINRHIDVYINKKKYFL